MTNAGRYGVEAAELVPIAVIEAGTRETKTSGHSSRDRLVVPGM